MGPHARQGGESSLEPRTSIARSTGTRHKQNDLRVPAVRQHRGCQGRNRNRGPVATTNRRRQCNQQQHAAKTHHGVTHRSTRPGSPRYPVRTPGSARQPVPPGLSTPAAAALRSAPTPGWPGTRPPGIDVGALVVSAAPSAITFPSSRPGRRHDHLVMAGDGFHDIIARFTLLFGLFRVECETP